MCIIRLSARRQRMKIVSYLLLILQRCLMKLLITSCTLNRSASPAPATSILLLHWSATADASFPLSTTLINRFPALLAKSLLRYCRCFCQLLMLNRFTLFDVFVKKFEIRFCTTIFFCWCAASLKLHAHIMKPKSNFQADWN